MHDVLAQLRAAQPMPRGERLATWEMRRDIAGPPLRKWYRLFTGSRVALAMADKRLSHLPAAERLRIHAAPLALARERRRRERAEMNAKVLKSALSATDGMFHEAMARVQFAMADMAVAMSKTFAAWTFDHERACRMERDGVLTRRVWRLVTKRMSKPPTREEVERAVVAFAAHVERAQMAPHSRKAEHRAKAAAARDALVKLATRWT